MITRCVLQSEGFRKVLISGPTAEEVERLVAKLREGVPDPVTFSEPVMDAYGDFVSVCRTEV